MATARRAHRHAGSSPLGLFAVTWLSDTMPILLVALMAEAAFGYPSALYARIGHPVTWIGRLVARLDARMNEDGAAADTRRRAGFQALLIVIAAAVVPAAAAWMLLTSAGLAGAILLVLASGMLLAQRSLHEHVAHVAASLRTGGLDTGREALSHLAGCDPADLDEHAVCRAAIESLADNFSEGVVAPAVWLGAGGLTGGAFCKAVNITAGMIGRRTRRHAQFGRATARLGDLVNLPASRLAAMLIAAASPATGLSALRAAWRDGPFHRSPNAGWPEAALAGALGLRLAGPQRHGATETDDEWMGNGRAEATVDDIDRALALYRRACGLLWAGVAVLSLGVLLR